MMELEPDYTRERGNGSGTETAYTVEARFNYHAPIMIAGQIFDDRWRRVNFQHGKVGVPAASPFDRHTIEHGLLGYAAAQALRWWLHATADAQSMGCALCLESRLVEHRISYTHKIEAIAAHGYVGGEDRSNCIPDWGARTTARGD